MLDEKTEESYSYSYSDSEEKTEQSNKIDLVIKPSLRRTNEALSGKSSLVDATKPKKDNPTLRETVSAFFPSPKVQTEGLCQKISSNEIDISNSRNASPRKSTNT